MNVRLSAPTTCYRCGGWLAEGEKVTVEWDEAIDGYIHRHTRAALCRRFSAFAESKRKVEHEIVMEAIYGTITNSSEDCEAEADEGDAVEGEEETKDKRDLPSMRVHLPRHARALSPLRKRAASHRIPQE